MLLAAESPDRVAALVLVAPATPSAKIPWPVRALRTPALGEAALALSTRRSVAFGLRHRLYARASRVTEDAIDDAWLPLTIPGTRRAALAAIRSDPRRYAGLTAARPCADAHRVGPRGPSPPGSRGGASGLANRRVASRDPPGRGAPPPAGGAHGVFRGGRRVSGPCAARLVLAQLVDSARRRSRVRVRTGVTGGAGETVTGGGGGG